MRVAISGRRTRDAGLPILTKRRRTRHLYLGIHKYSTDRPGAESRLGTASAGSRCPLRERLIADPCRHATNAGSPVLTAGQDMRPKPWQAEAGLKEGLMAGS